MQYETIFFSVKFPKYALIIAETWHILSSSFLYKWIFKNVVWVHIKGTEKSTFHFKLEEREEWTLILQKIIISVLHCRWGWGRGLVDFTWWLHWPGGLGGDSGSRHGPLVARLTTCTHSASPHWNHTSQCRYCHRETDQQIALKSYITI